MKIFGHSWVDSPIFYTVRGEKEIKATPPNSIVKLDLFMVDIAKYCQKNSIPYAVEMESIKEAIFANLLDAKYAIVEKGLAKELMPIAQNYLFDMQILARIESEDEIEEMARYNVDGVIFI